MKTPYFARYKDGTRIEVLRQDATHVECVNAGPDGPAVWRTALANITPEQPEATEARTKEANAGASGMAADWNELKALRADLAKAQARCAELESALRSRGMDSMPGWYCSLCDNYEGSTPNRQHRPSLGRPHRGVQRLRGTHGPGRGLRGRRVSFCLFFVGAYRFSANPSATPAPTPTSSATAPTTTTGAVTTGASLSDASRSADFFCSA